MRDIGMLYQPDMARANMAGQKGETRRTNGLDEINQNPDLWKWTTIQVYKGSLYATFCAQIIENDESTIRTVTVKCPYGVPGDMMWQRETYCAYWGAPVTSQHCAPAGVEIKQHDGTVATTEAEGENRLNLLYAADGPKPPVLDHVKWKPNIHMFRWASRFVTPILDIRLERLQDITNEGAKNEGVVPKECEESVIWQKIKYRAAYMVLWGTINGLESWDANPWVWVVKYKRFGEA